MGRHTTADPRQPTAERGILRHLSRPGKVSPMCPDTTVTHVPGRTPPALPLHDAVPCAVSLNVWIASPPTMLRSHFSSHAE